MPRLYMRGFWLIFCTAAFFSAAVKTEAAPQIQKPPSISKNAAAAATDYSQEPLVYESVRGKLRYENDGTGVREVVARIHVQDALGVQRAGQLIFEYNSSNQNVEIRSVRVIKPDGTEITTGGPDSVQDLSAPVAREAPMYTDARQKHVTVAGLGVGDYLEYDVVTTTTKPMIPNQFWQTWTFVRFRRDLPG